MRTLHQSPPPSSNSLFHPYTCQKTNPIACVLHVPALFSTHHTPYPSSPQSLSYVRQYPHSTQIPTHVHKWVYITTHQAPLLQFLHTRITQSIGVNTTTHHRSTAYIPVPVYRDKRTHGVDMRDHYHPPLLHSLHTSTSTPTRFTQAVHAHRHAPHPAAPQPSPAPHAQPPAPAYTNAQVRLLRPCPAPYRPSSHPPFCFPPPLL